MKLNKFSITSQMISSLVITSLFIIIFGTLFQIFHTINHEKSSFIRTSGLEADLVVNLITAPLAFFDIEGVKSNMQHLHENKSVLLSAVYDANQKPLTSISHTNQEFPSAILPLGIRYENLSWIPEKLEKLKITLEIKQDDQLLGYLYIEKDTKRITDFIAELLSAASFFSVGLLFFVYIVSTSISKKILQPILTLTEAAKEVADTSNYSLRVAYNKKNEISYLYNAFNHLLSDTESLTTNLESRVDLRTKELQDSLEMLKKTQAQLIELEKMAALGNLVSGVAHEVNTPLGNAITGGSIIERETKLLLQQMEDGTLKKSVMEQKLNILKETSHLLLTSVNHAANLIRSFKRISVDQSIEEKQDFNLNEYLKEILLTFHNKLKKIPVTVKLEGDPNLVIRSYPGVYAQIINNFIQNSLLHGFDSGTKDATITISFTVEDQQLILTYSDNGSGIDETIKNTAFEPFRTTKRSQGGTGLGLSIVYNLVTQKLLGTITLNSEPQKGVIFILTLPLKLPSSNKESVI